MKKRHLIQFKLLKVFSKIFKFAISAISAILYPCQYSASPRAISTNSHSVCALCNWCNSTTLHRCLTGYNIHYKDWCPEHRPAHLVTIYVWFKKPRPYQCAASKKTNDKFVNIHIQFTV